MSGSCGHAALDAVIAEVAVEGGAARALERVAREASDAVGGPAAIVRFSADACAPLAVWPHLPHGGWLVDLPPGWHVGIAPTSNAQRVGPHHAAAPILVDGRPRGALVARLSPVPEHTVPTGHPVLERLAGLVAFGAACRVLLDAHEPAVTHPPMDAPGVAAGIDALTGLANHRAFRERLAGEHRRAGTSGEHLALVLLDIDRLKRINDTCGHLAGDELLTRIARHLVACGRRDDLVARIGGGEFAWVMPGTDAASAREAADRLRAAVAGERIGPAEGVTLSAGICTAAQAGDLDEMIRFAEGALYWAKDRGRNATYVFSPDVVRVISEEEKGQHRAREHAMRSIQVLARAVDAKDQSTREHSERVADLAVQIAVALGWSMERTAELRDAGLLHDVGKIGIPDAVLLKPGGLSDAEYELVKSHPELGARIASDVLNEEQQAWVRGHHERFDGRGYPDGLAGEDISEGARILALADSWDVMTSVRSYREAWSLEEALLDCRAEKGRQFWPDAVEALELVVEAGALLVQSHAPTAVKESRPPRATEVA